MNTDINTIKEIMLELDIGQSKAAQLIFNETGHTISQGTISRVLRGESKGVTTTLVRYALQNIQNKQKTH